MGQALKNESNTRPRYKVMVLTKDGVLVELISLVAQDDVEAAECAKMMVRDHDVELWDGLRFIDQYKADTWSGLLN